MNLQNRYLPKKKRFTSTKTEIGEGKGLMDSGPHNISIA